MFVFMQMRQIRIGLMHMLLRYRVCPVAIFVVLFGTTMVTLLVYLSQTQTADMIRILKPERRYAEARQDELLPILFAVDVNPHFG